MAPDRPAVKRRRPGVLAPRAGIGPTAADDATRPRPKARPPAPALACSQGRPRSPLGWKFVAAQIAEGQVSFVANWLATRAAVPSETAAALIAMTRAMTEGLLPPRAG